MKKNIEESLIFNRITRKIEQSNPKRPLALLACSCALMVVTLLMTVLPFLYFSLLFISFGSVVYYAYWGIELFGVLPLVVAAVLYAGPLLCALVVTAFLYKPIIFRKDAKEPQGYLLKRGSNTPLFKLIEDLCFALGVPIPQKIVMTSDVRVSITHGGIIGGILCRDLTLRIGLPLVASTNSKQFIGALTIELAKLSDRRVGGFSYVVRGINMWFSTLVYEKDLVDEKLEKFALSDKGAKLFVVNFSRVMVWLTRKVFWWPMMFSHIISSYPLRSLELYADKCAARIVGSKVVEDLIRQLGASSYSAALVDEVLCNAYDRGQVVDDYCEFMICLNKQLSNEIKEAISQQYLDYDTALFDSHPSAKERIARISKKEVQAMVDDEISSGRFFDNLETLSRDVTECHYEELELDKGSRMCVSAEVCATKEVSEAAIVSTAQELFGSLTALDQPLDIDSLPFEQVFLSAFDSDIESEREEFIKAQQMSESLQAQFDRLLGRQMRTEEAITKLEAGFDVGARDWELIEEYAEYAEYSDPRCSATSRQMTDIYEDLEEVRRMAVRLVRHCSFTIERKEGLDEHTKLRASCATKIIRALYENQDSVKQVMSLSTKLATLVSQLEPGENSENLVELIADYSEQLAFIRSTVTSQLDALGDRGIGFIGSVSLSEYLTASYLDDSHRGTLVEEMIESQQWLQKVNELYYGSLGYIVETGAEVA